MLQCLLITCTHVYNFTLILRNGGIAWEENKLHSWFNCKMFVLMLENIKSHFHQHTFKGVAAVFITKMHTVGLVKTLYGHFALFFCQTFIESDEVYQCSVNG